MSNEPSNAANHVADPERSGSGDLPNIHRADPRFRRRMFALLAVCLTAAVICVALLPGWLGELRQSHAGSDPADLEQLLRIGFTALALLLIAPMLLLARLSLGWAQRIENAGCFPTSDMKVIRDVPIRHGEAARRMARLHRLAGNLLVWLSVALMAWTAWIWLG